jgi:hypothetical protein
MEIVYIQKATYLKDYKYIRVIDPDTNLMVSVGENINKDTIISRGSISRMSYRIKVSDFASNFHKYVSVLHGEVIHKGDSIMNKGKKNIFSPVDGIIDLSHLSSGFILVKSYPEDIMNVSNINGIVSSISEEKDKVIINTSVLKIDLKYIFGSNIEAKFKYLCNEQGFLYLEDINTSAIGTIIYVGNLITMEIIKKSLAVGVVGIIGNGIEIRNNESIEDFINSIPLTVGVIDGFGSIENSFFYSILSKYNRFPAFIDQNNQAFIIPIDTPSEDSIPFEIKGINKGDKVQIFSFPYWGYTGTIESFNIEDQSVFVALDFGSKVNVQIEDIVGII